jgi:protocatechuate 3,4-dioxygenase beta subunit
MKRVLPVVVVVAIAAVAGFLLYGHERASPTTKPSRGSAGSGSPRTTSVPGTDHAPAHVDATVTDAKGPIAGAVVRFAGPGGDIVVAKAGADGLAHVDGLAPGSWTASASAPDHEPAAAKARELQSGENAAIAIVLPLGGRALTGLVTDATGGPVSGARVDAARLGGLARAGDAVASTTTATDGRYKLTIGEGQATVAVNHPDYAPQQRYVDIAETGTIANFQLVPGGVIEGEVRDERSKAPVAGARVVASRDQTMSFGEAAAHRVTAGPDGHFRITGLRPGAYSLEASLGPLYSNAPTVVGLGVAEQVSDVVILVGNGAAIRGIVVDEHDAPVAGIEVSTFGNREYSSEDKSDAKGAFAVAGLSPGRYELVGNGDDYITSGTTAVDVATKDVDNVRVRVRRGGRVKGHVEPRQACEVKLDSDNDDMHGMPMMIAPQQTAADGEFALGPVQPTPYTVTARCPSGEQGSKQIQVTPGMADVVIEVKPGASIAGRVVDGRGKPLAGATVNAAPLTSGERTTIVNGMMTSGSAALTSATGTFELKGLVATTYRLRVLDRGRPLPMKTTEAATKIAIGATDHKTGVELVVDRPDGVIKGNVIGPDGKPLADAWVSVEQSFDDMLGLHGDGGSDGGGPGESRTVMIDSSDGGESNAIAPVLTDASGHFEISGLARTPWRVVAEAQAGKLRGHTDAVKPDATITITIAGVSELHGQVHVTGTPPPWFQVELEGPTGAQRTFGWTDGSFAFGRVDPGDYTVRVTSAAGNGEAAVKVGATAGAPVQITLASNAVVTGKLVDKDGAAIPDVGVVCVPDQGPGRLQISLDAPPPRTGPDGSFRVETKAGTVVVAAMTPGAPTTKRGVVLQAGQTVDIGPLVVDAKPPPK